MVEHSKTVNLTGGMPPHYDTASLIAGLAMIVVGAVGAAKSKGD
jgi:hypothetical protein